MRRRQQELKVGKDGTVTVKILKDIPRLAYLNEKREVIVVGPFSEGEITNMPVIMARNLSRKKYVELV